MARQASTRHIQRVVVIRREPDEFRITRSFIHSFIHSIILISREGPNTVTTLINLDFSFDELLSQSMSEQQQQQQ